MALLEDAEGDEAGGATVRVGHEEDVVGAFREVFGGAGLPRDVERRPQPGLVRGAADALRDEVEAVPDRVQRDLRDGKRPHLFRLELLDGDAAAGRRLADAPDQERLSQDTGVGDRRVGVDQLDRRGQHEALADRHVHGVAAEPVLADVVELPLRVGHEAGRFLDADAGRAAVSELADEVGEDVLVDLVQPLRQVEEDRVAGRHQALCRRQPAAVDGLPVSLGEVLAQSGPDWHAVER